MPSKTCISELFMSLDKDELEKAFRQWSVELAKTDKTQPNNKNTRGKNSIGLQIAIDGKTLKGSYDRVINTEAINLISIFLVEKGLILAHLDVQNKDSEMVGVRELLNQQDLVQNLNLANVKVITMDALHCQKKP